MAAITLPALPAGWLQRPGDGYVNASHLCARHGERWEDYLNATGTDPWAPCSYPTRELVAAFAEVLEIPFTDLIRLDAAGDAWIHPRLAVAMAQWVSPEWAVKVYLYLDAKYPNLAAALHKQLLDELERPG
jgi:hypothetical protein